MHRVRIAERDGLHHLLARLRASRASGPGASAELIGDLQRRVFGHAELSEFVDEVAVGQADQDRPEHRKPNARAKVPGGLRDSGDLGVGTGGRPVQGVGADRSQDHAHSSPGDDQRPLLIAHVELRDPSREHHKSDSRHDAADQHGLLRSAAVEHVSTDLRGDHESDEEIHQVLAGLARVFAKRDLRVLTREEKERHERDRHQREDDVVAGEALVTEDLQLKQRQVNAELALYERSAKNHAGDDATERSRVQPSPVSRLLEAKHHKTHRAGNQHGAEVVELLRALLVVRLGQVDHDQRDDRYRDVDPEDRAPGPFD